MKDIHGNPVKMPKFGEKVLRDGYEFTVSKVIPRSDINIIASITLRGTSGMCEVGYYDYLKHPKA